jgi:hypothetical protein
MKKKLFHTRRISHYRLRLRSMSFANWKGALLDMDLAAHGTVELEKGFTKDVRSPPVDSNFKTKANTKP